MLSGSTPLHNMHRNSSKPSATLRILPGITASATVFMVLPTMPASSTGAIAGSPVASPMRLRPVVSFAISCGRKVSATSTALSVVAGSSKVLTDEPDVVLLVVTEVSIHDVSHAVWSLQEVLHEVCLVRHSGQCSLSWWWSASASFCWHSNFGSAACSLASPREN